MIDYFSPSNLRFVKLKVLSEKECLSRKRFNYDPKSYLCLTGYEHERQSADHGDSGSPLVLKHNNKDVVIGVCMGGFSGNSHKNSIGLYTRVSTVLDWIKKQIEDYL